MLGSLSDERPRMAPNAASPRKGGRPKLPPVKNCPIPCKGCKEIKHPDEFPVHNQTGRPRSYCRPCFNARQRKSYHRHRKKRLTEQREYRETRNVEARRAYARRYYVENYDRVRAQLTEAQRKRRERLRNSTDPEIVKKLQDERERRRAFCRAYYAANREIICAQLRAKRARKASVSA